MEGTVLATSERRTQDTVVNNRNPLWRIAFFLDQPPFDGFCIHNDPVSQATDLFIDPPLPQRPILSGVPDGSQHDRHTGQTSGRNSEDIRVKIVGMNNIDPVTLTIGGQS